MTALPIPEIRLPMSDPAKADFLARPLLARMGTVQDGQPRVTPMWFVWDGTDIWMETSPTYTHARIIRQHPRAALSIDETTFGVGSRAVLMRGAIELIDSPPDLVMSTVRRIYTKYLGEAGILEPIPQVMLSEAHVLLRFHPEWVKAWDSP